MKKTLVFLFLGFIPALLFSSSVKIGIFTDHQISSLWFTPDHGNYVLFGDTLRIIDLDEKSSIQLLIKHDQVIVKHNGKHLGSYKKVKLLGEEAPNSYKIKPLSPSLAERIYNDNLEVSAKGKYLSLINRVNIDHYVAGVVESENGIKQKFEYYKAKSIICRTYALSNLKKHEDDGYSLCDRVHCQVYKSKNLLNDDILMAAVATTGVVLVDSDLNLITAAFHSNCGGQTVNSEDVWSMPTTYLKSVVDTFCLNQPHASWELKIKKSEWTNYFEKFHKHNSADSAKANCIYGYNQSNRSAELICEELKVPFKTIRNDFKLKSTFFSLHTNDDDLLIKGKGYGHGIGLCQEGAMRMAELGMAYAKILHFYYQNIHLVDLSVLDLFREQ
jgi:stage II sporulation protein D